MKKVGLFFGSFNPVHIGHLFIANYVWQHSDVDEVWMVISPQNPFKKKDDLWEEELRLKLLKIAIGEHDHIKVCDIEFELPKPSYTFNTLRELKNRHPEIAFALIVGEDIVHSLSNWKKGKELIEENHFIIYPRKNDIEERIEHDHFEYIDAPRLDISSTYVRNSLASGKDIRYIVGKDVYDSILELKMGEI